MRAIALIGLVALISDGSVSAQTTVLHPSSPSGGLSVPQPQPFKLDSANLKSLLVDCKQTTLAGAAQEIKTKTQHALMAGTALAVVEFLTAAEGAEGRAASEFIPILVSKLRTPAALGLFNAAELKVYEGRGYRLNDTFQVCSPTIGLSQLTVVRPVVPGSKGSRIGLGDPLQPMPILSPDALRRLRLAPPEDNSLLASLLPPTCDSPAVNLMAELRNNAVFAAVNGTVVDINTRTLSLKPITSPAQGARIDLIGPSPATCVTSASGQFNFHHLLSGSYTLQVTQAGYWTSTSSLKLEWGPATSFDIPLTSM